MVIRGDTREAARHGIGAFIELAWAQTETDNFDGAAESIANVVFKKSADEDPFCQIRETLNQFISIACFHASSGQMLSAVSIIDTAKNLSNQAKNYLTEQDFRKLQRIVKQVESSIVSSKKLEDYIGKNEFLLQWRNHSRLGEIEDFVREMKSLNDVDIFITQEALKNYNDHIVIAHKLNQISRKLVLAGDLDLAWKTTCKLVDHYSWSHFALHEYDSYLMLLGLVSIEEWLPAAAEVLDGVSQSEAENVLGLINHARDAVVSSKGPKPSKRWLDQGQVWISKFDVNFFSETFPQLIKEASRSYKDKIIKDRTCRFRQAKREFIIGGSWIVFLSDSSAGVKAVASAFKPSPNAAHNKLGNVTRKVLVSIGSSDSAQNLEAIKQLKKLMALYPNGNEGHQLRLAYAAVGKAKNLSITELDALVEADVASDFCEGTLAFGEYSVKIVFDDLGRVSLFWTGPNGKLLNGAPAEAHNLFKRELNELKEKVKDIRTAISLKSRHLESEMRSENPRAYGVWQEEFLGNPVTRSIVERLIWRIEGKSSCFTVLVRDGELVDIDGNILREIQDEFEIKLWHPLDSSVHEVLRWRKRIETLKIVQPFKQAHREVYILTDAERRSATFSTRFSGHILKGPQFLKLCKARNWKSSRWRDCATVDIGGINVSASLQLDWEIDLNEGCPSYLTPSYVFTGKMSFFKSDLQCPLEEVPPKIFSEIMRDVDLFVGVSSVGNDPNWRDHGNRKANNYWETYAFGELSASAETRRDLLERLLPNLADLSHRCHLENRFLVIKGDLRTYRIHLGSSNIQMEPDNQYLCIVPRKNVEPQDEEETIFLPFIGDATLSLIISKALLLANDRNIKDVVIMNQIRS